MLTKGQFKIIDAIQDFCDGVGGRRHVWQRALPNVTTERGFRKAMQPLCDKRLVKRAIIHYQRSEIEREPYYWLAANGILAWCAYVGIEDVYIPKHHGEYQQRELHSNLRKIDVRWVRQPQSPAKLEHHFWALDFKLRMQKCADQLPSITMHWLNESAFRSPKMDKVEYRVSDQNGRLVEKERGVCPDSFCWIQDSDRANKRGELYTLNLLIEIDMSTHPVSSRFAINKAAPYAAYIGSPTYKERFGVSTGEWLIITTGAKRMQHLIQTTQATVHDLARFFLFTTFDQFNKNLLTDPIWLRPRPRGQPKRWALLVDKS